MENLSLQSRYRSEIWLQDIPEKKYSDTSANEDNSFRNHIR